MMAKIVQGRGFRGAIKYVMDREKAELLSTQGLRLRDLDSLVHSFSMQSNLNPIAKPVAHISLDFSAQDREKLTNEKMVEIADEYMAKMGYGNTQYLIVRHYDRDHPHIHLVINRIDNDGKRITDQNERIRNMKICKELTEKHGLYMSSGKENVKRHRLREPDATKYRIYDSLVKNVPLAKTWAELERRLQGDGITVGFKTKGSTSHVEGVRFTANDLSFNGSKVDKQFSYSKIDFALKQNAKVEAQRLQPQPTPSHSAIEEVANISGGMFDLPIETHGTDPEEDEFRRRMQRKKRGVRR